ncbi:uncharacterized protein BDZ99DRAFT_380488, partial [Mytilinidion resinicola]
KCFELNYYYLGYNGKVFGKVATTFSISEFYLIRKIASLNIFPLIYYKTKAKIRQNFIYNRRKFIFLKGINYYKYKGFGYFRINKGPLKFLIRGRIIVNAIAFKNANPNYSKPQVNKTY